MYYNFSFFFLCNRSVEQKLSNDGSRYNVVQAQAIVTELREIQQSLSSGQRERSGLMHSLAKLKDDLTRLQLCSATDDPDIQGQNSPSAQLSDKLSTASQTDLSGEVCAVYTSVQSSNIICSTLFHWFSTVFGPAPFHPFRFFSLRGYYQSIIYSFPLNFLFYFIRSKLTISSFNSDIEPTVPLKYQNAP